ncbi:MAG: acyl carrier protein [Clostridiales bacterium]|nr:acyl carrier protein [Clostridiales bacterium]
MSTEEKIAKIEEIMELDAGELSIDSRLVDLDEWDSISILSFVAMVGDEFGREISTEETKSIVTVGDAIKFME